MPVTKEPIPRSRLIEMLFEVAAELYPAVEQVRSRPMQVRYNAMRATIRKLDEFLQATEKADVVIDEQLIRDFEAHAVATGIPAGSIRPLLCQSRKLINLLPKLYLQRTLVPLAEVNKATRFSSYTPQTQAAFVEFLRNGRQLKQKSTHQNPELSNELLSDIFRKQIIDSTLTFMTAIDAHDLFALTLDEVEEFIDAYDENDKKVTAYNLLDYIRPLFSNLRATGQLQHNILADVPRRVSSSNLDYVDQPGIDRLADLSTLDMNSFKDVRGRLAAFSLDYDYALRNMESSLIRCSDFTGVELHLPKPIQKIKKDTLPLYSYFPEVTGILLKRYLELRAMKSPDTDLLMVSCDGKPIGADGCRHAVKEHCAALGIKTHAGKTVVPHRLRHSFGTLNIAPLGIGLEITEVMEQYRHANIQTTYDLYIAKNPLRKRLSYEKRMSKVNGASVVQRVPEPAMTAPAAVVPRSAHEDNFIAEAAALAQVRPLGLAYRTLRKYSQDMNKVRQNGKGYEYSAEFIADLASNHFTREEAMALVKLSKSAFFGWVKKNEIEFVTLGRTSLFRKDVILNKLMPSRLAR